MAYQIGFYIRNSFLQEATLYRTPFQNVFYSWLQILQHMTLVDSLSVNKPVLMPRAGYKNVLITKYEILHYIKLKLYTGGHQQDREFLDPGKILWLRK